jgi:uncharacterized BrkB/YihY/UPF0761 family membrane protein
MVETPPSSPSAVSRRIIGLTLPVFITLCVVILLVVIVVFYLASLRWTGLHPSPVADAILGIVIIDGPVPIVIDALAFVGVVLLLVRRPTGRRILTAVLSVAAGGILGWGIFLISSATEAFGLQLHWVVGAWTPSDRQLLAREPASAGRQRGRHAHRRSRRCSRCQRGFRA